MPVAETAARSQDHLAGLRPHFLFIVGVISLLAPACGLIPKGRAPELDMEGARQLTDDSYLYEFPVWSPDGTTIAVSRNMRNQFNLGPDQGAWEIVLVDVSTGDIESLTGPGPSTDPTWSPSGDELAVMIYETDQSTAGQGESLQLAIFSKDDRSWRLIPCGSCGYPNWLNDGKILVSVNLGLGSDGQVQYGKAKVDPVSGEVSEERPYSGINSQLRAISPAGELVLMGGPYAVYPDGDVLLMRAHTDDCSGIWSYGLESAGPVPLVDSLDLYECDPALSKGGTKLAYTVKGSSEFDPTTLMIANFDGSSAIPFLAPGGYIYQIRFPAWSPDGRQMAFVYGKFDLTSPSFSTLYIVDVPLHLQPPSATD